MELGFCAPPHGTNCPGASLRSGRSSFHPQAHHEKLTPHSLTQSMRSRQRPPCWPKPTALPSSPRKTRKHRKISCSSGPPRLASATKSGRSTNLQTWTTPPGFPAAAAGPAQAMPFATEGSARFFQVRELDEQPPVLLSQYPKDGGFAVPRFADLTLQFSDAAGLDPNSIRLTVGAGHVHRDQLANHVHQRPADLRQRRRHRLGRLGIEMTATPSSSPTGWATAPPTPGASRWNFSPRS